MNRVLTTRLAVMHFAPTERARDALIAEGVPPSDVFLTGNTVIDALLQTLNDSYRFKNTELSRLDPERRMVLITAHRRESFGAPLRSICAAVAELASGFSDVDFVLPVHPNPEVKKTVHRFLEAKPNIRLVEPVGYEEFAHLMFRAHVVLTDSGGIQEEAPSLGKPVLVLREVTERPEGVEAGTAVVVGTDSARIVAETNELLTVESHYEKMANAVNPYGDGRASARIVDALAARFG
jgi:UDP-N-acetylglucosamine 2-epimerase (non-hydrolysing)